MTVGVKLINVAVIGNSSTRQSLEE